MAHPASLGQAWNAWDAREDLYMGFLLYVEGTPSVHTVLHMVFQGKAIKTFHLTTDSAAQHTCFQECHTQ